MNVCVALEIFPMEEKKVSCTAFLPMWLTLGINNLVSLLLTFLPGRKEGENFLENKRVWVTNLLGGGSNTSCKKQKKFLVNFSSELKVFLDPYSWRFLATVSLYCCVTENSWVKPLSKNIHGCSWKINVLSQWFGMSQKKTFDDIPCKCSKFWIELNGKRFSYQIFFHRKWHNAWVTRRI